MIDLPKWEIVENKLPHSFAGLITSGMYEGTMFFISELYLISNEDFEYKVVTDVRKNAFINKSIKAKFDIVITPLDSIR